MLGSFCIYSNQYHLPISHLHYICWLLYVPYIENSLGQELASYSLCRSQAGLEWLLFWSNRYGYWICTQWMWSVPENKFWHLREQLRTNATSGKMLNAVLSQSTAKWWTGPEGFLPCLLWLVKAFSYFINLCTSLIACLCKHAWYETDDNCI